MPVTDTVPLSVVILSYNCEETIDNAVRLALRISDDVHVVDSYSDDNTVERARSAGASVVEHEFGNYSLQRNWAIEELPFAHDWQLHLDADEYLSEQLEADLRNFFSTRSDDFDAALLPRLVRFLGRDIRHGGMYPIFHARLFRAGAGRCEDRLYDQHFIVTGRVHVFRNPMIDEIELNLGEWTTRHNRWSTAEVDQLLRRDTGNSEQLPRPIQRRREAKSFYYSLPLFLRCGLLFTYRYVFRRGFFDGVPGLIFFVLQTFWFRFLVDAKLYEARRGPSVEPPHR